MVDKCRHCGVELAIGKVLCEKCGGEPIPEMAPARIKPKIKKSYRRYFGAIAVVGTVLCFAAILFGVMVAQQSRKQATCDHNLQKIGLALHNYHDTYLSLPAGTIEVDGTPRHSWRTLLLPYLEHSSMHEKIRFSEPWDSPHNSQFHDKIPEVYRCPFHPESNKTSYLAFDSEHSIFFANSGIRFRDVTDGTANTVAVIETGTPTVNWMEPRDIEWEHEVSDPTALVSPHLGAYHLLTVSGDVFYLPADTSFDEFHNMVHRHDGNVVKILKKIREEEERQRREELKRKQK